MFKKFALILTILLSVFLVACQTATTADPNSTLPDLTGYSRVEIQSTLEDLDLTVKFYFDNSVIYDSEDDYDKFVQYGSDLAAGDVVLKGTEIKVYTSPLNLTVEYYNDLSNYDSSLQLEESDFDGKEFISDGIGEVTVNRFIDGDTTEFKSGGVSFSVRYLGIDTPESTALYEAWGKAAANYTRERLENAEQIVLQAEGERQDGNERYLAWVWYVPDGEDTFILLNLELVELAYSKNKVSSGSIYSEVLLVADWNASLTKRRVWGELDPQYDYSKEGVQMTIEYLMQNFNDYVGLKVVVSGEITRMIGQNIYIQDSSGSGVYMYAGFTSSAQLQVGANVTIGGLIPTYYSGSPQLSNFNKVNLGLNTDVLEIEPTIVTYDDFDFELIGTLVKVEHLTVTNISYASTSSSESVDVRDSSNNTFTVRIDDSTGLSASELGLSVGSVITVSGPLSYYDFDYNNNPETYNWLNSYIQLMLTDDMDLVIE